MPLLLCVRLACGLALLGVIGLAWRSALTQAAPKPAAETSYGIGHPPAFAPLSAASCASAACHGGGEVGRKGSEHSTWAPDESRSAGQPSDPHSRAYRALFTDESARMAKAVGGGVAYKNDLCLKCHAVPDVSPKAAVSEGVGCGACHGPADGWLTAHTLPGWAGIPNRERWEKYGLNPTKNLVARSLACAGCHVGDTDREVNHGLIAAGHPRLAFESARSHFRPAYRKHWQERTPTADFEVRAWAVGQAANLRASVDLLRARAERATRPNSSAPWPELAAQSCYACHHPIGDRPVSPGARPLGVAGWEVWPTAAAEVAAAFTPELYPGVRTPELKALLALKAAMGKRVPDATAVAKLAAEAVQELDSWLAAIQVADDAGPSPLPADTPRKVAHALAGHALSPDRKTLADSDWDALAAHYLGCAAVYHAAGGAKAVPTWAEPVRELTALLAFPPGYAGPKDFDEKKREAVRKQFAALHDATAAPGGK